MATLKAFIFDLDGVIADTTKLHFKAWQQIAESLGITLTEADNEQLKGLSRKQSLNKILEWGSLILPQAQKEALMRQKNEWFLALIKQNATHIALPGAIDFIEKTKKLNFKIALGSASQNAPLILEKLQITQHFNALIDGNVVNQSKPNPQVFLKGAEALGLSPQECVVFEDSLAGLAAAKTGEFKTVGIGTKKNLGQAHLVVRALQDISPAGVLNKLNGKL